MRKLVLVLAAAGFFGLLSVKSAAAFDFRKGEAITVSQEETIAGTFGAAGQTVKIDGAIDGDIFCAGQTVEINGTVAGDVLFAGQQLTVNGTVDGNVRGAGQTITIKGKVGKNLTAFGQKIIVEGEVGGEMFSGAETISLAGKINRDVYVFVNKLNLEDGSLINGNLTYESKANAETGEQAVVAGETIHNLPKDRTFKPEKISMFNRFDKNFYPQNRAERWLKSFLTNLTVLLLAVFFAQKVLVKTADRMLKNSGRCLWTGFLVFILPPALAVTLVLTILGIPLAAILILVYALAIFAARLLTAFVVGRKITSEYWQAKKDSLIVSALAGMLVSWLAFSLPFVGKVFSLAAIIWGLGGMYQVLTNKNRK